MNWKSIRVKQNSVVNVRSLRVARPALRNVGLAMRVDNAPSLWLTFAGARRLRALITQALQEAGEE